MSYVLEGPHWSDNNLTWSLGKFNYTQDKDGDKAFSHTISSSVQQDVVRAAFARWQSVSGLTFQEVADSPTSDRTADIRVGYGTFIDQNYIGLTNYLYTPDGSPNGGTFTPDVIVRLEDPTETPLVTDESGALGYKGFTTQLYQVVLHEIGHALGLGHVPDDKTAVMNPTAGENNRDINAVDIAGIQRLYGTPADARTQVTAVYTPPNSGAGTVVAPSPVILHGQHDQYLVSPHGDGSFVVRDRVDARDGSTSISTTSLQPVTVMTFADGVAVVDPSGVSQDVFRLYQAAFSRPAELAGVQLWSNAIQAGAFDLHGVAEQFTHQMEFIAREGGLSSTDYVQSLYRNILGRDGEADGVGVWTRAMDVAGYSQGKVLDAFASGDENISRTLPVAGSKDGAQVARLYQAAFNRAPEVNGLRFWTSNLHAGVSAVDMAGYFLKSDEAANAGLSGSNFVDNLYRNVLHRAPDSAGAAQWQRALDSGVSKAGALLGFADSNENRELTAGLTHDGWAYLGKQV